jgi:putative nucleotidyltransferase with HDIG domain
LTEVSPARAEAELLLGSSSDRSRHVAGVAAAAARVARVVAAGDRELLVAAAWLHDIGYAEELATTGFHPLDGARYLRTLGAPDRLCRLVAHHTCAAAEAETRDLTVTLDEEFPAEISSVADALTYADMTTGPTGLTVSVADRLAEILVRYPAGHVVHESIVRATPQILAATCRVEERLASQPR